MTVFAAQGQLRCCDQHLGKGSNPTATAITCGNAGRPGPAARLPSALVSVLVSFLLDVRVADLPDQAVYPAGDVALNR